MPTKIFTTLGGSCPYGHNVELDSPGCRKCEDYFRAGTGMFFWCRHQPAEQEPKPRKIAIKAKPAKKRGRPRKNAQKRPIKADEKKKR